MNTLTHEENEEYNRLIDWIFNSNIPIDFQSEKYIRFCNLENKLNEEQESEEEMINSSIGTVYAINKNGVYQGDKHIPGKFNYDNWLNNYLIKETTHAKLGGNILRIAELTLEEILIERSIFSSQVAEKIKNDNDIDPEYAPSRKYDEVERAIQVIKKDFLEQAKAFLEKHIEGLKNDYDHSKSTNSDKTNKQIFIKKSFILTLKLFRLLSYK